MSLACATGCVRYGRHATDCADDECNGCEPRLAVIGVICVSCHGRLAQNLSRVPDLITRIRWFVQPGAVKRSEMVTASRTPPPPLSLGAVDDADRLYAVLSACSEAAEAIFELDPISATGWRTAGSAGQVVGLRAGGAGDDSVAMVRRLLTHLDRISTDVWVVDLATDIGEVVRVSQHRYPDHERRRYLPTPCPRCDMLSLVRWAPETFEGAVTIACNRAECGMVVREDLYEAHALGVLVAKQAEIAEAKRVLMTSIAEVA